MELMDGKCIDEELPVITRPVHVVIPASGLGVRCKTDPPKQFLMIGGRPVISHTIAAFEAFSFVKTIIVTTPPLEELHLNMKTIVDKWNHRKVVLAQGTHTRHRSIFKGLECLKDLLKNNFQEDTSDHIVIIQDGVRPFVDKKTVFNIVTSAIEYHVSIGIVRPLVSTVVAIDEDNFLANVLDRTKHWASEMPQAFIFNLVYRAYTKCTEKDLDCGTECLKIVMENTGVRPRILHGPENLWKITYNKDVFAAQHMLSENVKSFLLLKLNEETCTVCTNEIYSDTRFRITNPQPLGIKEFDYRFTTSSNLIIILSDPSNFFQEINIALVKVTSHCNSSRDNQRKVVVVIFCMKNMQSHATDASNFFEFRKYVKQKSKELLQNNTFLYGIVAESNHLSSDGRDCLHKLVESINVPFLGQLFYF